MIPSPPCVRLRPVLRTILLACAILLPLAGCAPSPQGRLRFCEGFDAEDQPQGEASTFSPGVLSMLVEWTTPVTCDTLVVSVLRIEGGKRTSYGEEARIPMGPTATPLDRYRLDEVISFADTGRYVVMVRTRDRLHRAEGSVHIITPR